MSLSDIEENDNLYEILCITEDSTPSQIKSAYRRLALINHPDKVTEEKKEIAHKNFTKIAFAYSILSDPKRRKIYDTTGSINEFTHLDGDENDDFNWKEFFVQIFKQPITDEIIEQDKKEYRESGEEKRDILHFYNHSKGDLDVIFENVLHTNVLDDEKRVTKIINDAISNKEVKPFKKFVNESQEKKKKRRRLAKKEAKEAEELANELKLREKIKNKNKNKNKSENENENENNLDISDQNSLKSLIRKRSASKFDEMISNLEEKYTKKDSKKRSKKSKQSDSPENLPSEEEFQKLQAKLLLKAKK